jgi:release factor glutamine methyltransferase
MTDGVLHEHLAAARRTLVDAGLSPEDASLDADVLARHALDWDRTALLTRLQEPAPDGFVDRFDPLVTRRARREPLAYILGRREFWGLDFEVTRDVLIPRPETEVLVEEALAFTRFRPPRLVIDVGTGSGCVAIALARELTATRFIATDISDRALAVARRNAAAHAVGDRIEFRHADLLRGIVTRADLIVSNPPYVADRDRGSLPPEVVRFEPHGALFGGYDGLAVHKRLLEDAPRALVADGWLIVELGYDQHSAVAELAAEYGWVVEHVKTDLQGIPRTAVLKKVGGYG